MTKRKQDDEWNEYVRARAHRNSKKRLHVDQPNLCDVLAKVPDLWCALDARSIQAVSKTCKSVGDNIPFQMLTRLPHNELTYRSRHMYVTGQLRRRTLLSRMYKHTLRRRAIGESILFDSWKLNTHIWKHRATALNGGLTLLTAQADSRPDPFYTQHFCIECRRVVQTADVIKHPEAFIQFELGLVSEQFLCRAYFAHPQARKQLAPRKFDRESMGFHDRPHLCRECATVHDYMDIDRYCALHRLPSWTFSIGWRSEFGIVVTLVPSSSPLHNGRYAPRRLLDRHSRLFRKFALPTRLIDIPVSDICAWNAPSEDD